MSFAVTAGSSHARPLSAQDSVRAFYAWYLPIASGAGSSPPWVRVLHDRPDALSGALRRMLWRDLRRQLRVTGMIEGIDFDPFTGGQDSCARFRIGKTQIERHRYTVELRLSCVPGKDPAPIKVSTLRAGSRFVIDDVSYGGSDTLRRALDAE